MAKQKPPENETPRERFVRIASSRVDKALTAIKNIEGTANMFTYEYEDEQVRKILEALNAAVAEVREAFRNKGKKAPETGFTL